MQQPRTRDSDVPAFGEVLVLLCCSERRAATLLRRLRHSFKTETTDRGLARARLLFWVRVLKSIGPTAWRKIRGCGVLALLFGIGRWLMGS
jgi:hypothetical protein